MSYSPTRSFRHGMHLWSPRRRSSSGVKRSMSSPTTTVQTATESTLPTPMEVAEPPETKQGKGDEKQKRTEDSKQPDASGSGSYTDVLKDSMNAVKSGFPWGGDAASGEKEVATGLEQEKKDKASTVEGEDEEEEEEEEGDWAPNLFYAYARRTDDSNISRYLLTFSSGHVCNQWWSLVQQEFGGAPENTRESPQLFSFSGHDLPARAWKSARFQKLKTKWFYSQLGDAIGTNGRGQEIIPLQDERGYVIGSQQQKVAASSVPEPEPAPASVLARSSIEEPRTSSEENRVEGKGKEPQWERRRSKRDSGIILMSPHSERSQSIEETMNGRNFDFERMERNLEKVEKLMEQNAQQMRSLEHVQAANLERLTSALAQNAEMIQELAKGQQKLGKSCEELTKGQQKLGKACEELTRGQQKLGKACEELRMGFKERDERSERVSDRLSERMSEMMSERMSMAGSIAGSVAGGSVAGSVVQCGHDVRRPPRKVGRTVVGYVYANDRHSSMSTVKEGK